MFCPNLQVQKENNGNTTGKIPLKCKNVYIINFHIIRKPLHFLHVYQYHIINFMKTIHCFFNFLSIVFSWSHFGCIHITAHNQVKQKNRYPLLPPSCLVS